MQFPNIDHPITGTAVPLASLRTKESCGIGEFLDLISLGSLCKKCGLEVIQILPVNDTGPQKSPYSAVSAFALHPVYVRLQNLPESNCVRSALEDCKNRFAENERTAFEEVVRIKESLCRQIYAQGRERFENDAHLHSWIDANTWIKTYAVYKHVKQLQEEKAWPCWTILSEVSTAAVEAFWEKHQSEVLYYAWIQYHLERQLTEVAEMFNSINVSIKGDIPILMIEDSADVWMHRNFFHLDKRAGAPPDMYSTEGQNWGFPIYNWDELKKDNYSWWRRRLQQASKFYHAFRIDHVLGLFRIWTIPDYETSASMGYYVPNNYISRTALESSGFSDERITWLSRAHVYGEEIATTLQDEKQEVMPFFKQIGDEDLYTFHENIRGGSDIELLDISVTAREAMKTWKKNRTLVPVGEENYAAAWYYTDSRGYQSLNEHEKRELHHMIEQARHTSEKKWEQMGREILSVIHQETEMLECAEDLGVVPNCVPKVLEELNMLSLKIGFWTRYYHHPGQPFIPVSQYPNRSVATLSVHDSFVFREWWEDIASQDERIGFCEALKIEDVSKKSYSPAVAEHLIKGFFSTNSSLCILQIQDFFALDPNLRRTKESERINTPGTVSENNWTYRIPETLEELLQNDRLCSVIQKLTSIRRNRSLP